MCPITAKRLVSYGIAKGWLSYKPTQEITDRMIIKTKRIALGERRGK